MVPGSTLRYGSSFCIVTCKPRAVSNWPRLEAVRPLPSEETTPPVTKRCLVAVCGCLRNAGKSNLRDDGQGIAELAGACRPTEPHPNTDADNPSLTRPAVGGPRVLGGPQRSEGPIAAALPTTRPGRRRTDRAVRH